MHDVKCFGSEDRPREQFIAPNDHIFGLVTFKGDDIERLEEVPFEFPTEYNFFNDPAILTMSFDSSTDQTLLSPPDAQSSSHNFSFPSSNDTSLYPPSQQSQQNQQQQYHNQYYESSSNSLSGPLTNLPLLVSICCKTRCNLGVRRSL